MAEVTRTINGGVSYGTATATRCPRVVANNGSTDLEDSPYASIEVALTSAQVLALADTPVELVPAPGAGKVLQFLGALLILDFNSAGYTESSDNLTINYTNESGLTASEVIECTGFIDATADKMITAIPAKDIIPVANAALVLSNENDNFAVGDSPIRVKVLFAVHSTGL
jgi:hypothetical protein